MSRVYSPSQTTSWLGCPMRRALRREGWIGKGVGRRENSAVIGRAFAAGLGIYNTYRQTTGASNMPSVGDKKAREAITKAAIGVAIELAHASLVEWEKLGLSIEGDVGMIERLDGRITSAVHGYILNDPLPAAWEIVGVEPQLEEAYGNARPDLIVRDDMGLAVVDYKSKLMLRPEYKSKTLMEYAHNHQMLHYAWAVGDKFKEPVRRYYIGLAVLEPRFNFTLQPYPVHEDSLAIWEQSSRIIWGNMEREDNGEVPPFLAAQHADNFGTCEYYNACFKYRYDPVLMLQDYRCVEREKSNGAQ